jgi:predicted transcriptional regulator
MKIFISHSSKDVDHAKRLIDLLRKALNLRSSDIRCTSVNGYRLPAGTQTSKRLKQEVHEADVFIALISQNSIESIYVLFELGARWGTGKILIPILISDDDQDLLQGPLAEINAITCSVNSQVFQLIEDVANYLDLEIDNTSSYQKEASLFAKHASDSCLDRKAALPDRKGQLFDIKENELKILMLLGGEKTDDDGEIFIGELVRFLNMERKSIEKLIRKLQQKDLVKHASGSDQHVALTSKGEDIVSSI